MFKHRKFHLLVLVAVLLFGAFGASAQETANVVFWSPFTGPDGQTIEAMVQQFNETAGAEAGVNVELLLVPWDEYYTKLTVSLASNQAPNLAISHSHRVAALAQEGVLLEFADAALADLEISADDFVPALWAAGEYEGARYALPIDAFPRNVFYNKNVFTNAGLDPEISPVSYDELIAALDAIKATGGDDMIPLHFSTSGSWAVRDFYSVYFQLTPDLLNEDNSAVSDEFVGAATEALGIFKGFIDNGYAVATPGDWAALFAKDQVGIVFAQITHLQSLSQLEGLDFGTGVTPVLGNEAATFTLGHNFILPVGSGQDDAHLNATMTFIEWFGDNGLAWAEGGKVPATFAVINDPAFAELDAQSVATSQMDYMVFPPNTPRQAEIDTIVQEALEMVYGDMASVEDAVNHMAAEINNLLG